MAYTGPGHWSAGMVPNPEAACGMHAQSPQVPEVPLVLSDAVESVSKTSKALEILKKVGAVADVEKAKDSKQLRRGKGEWGVGQQQQQLTPFCGSCTQACPAWLKSLKQA